MPIPLSELTIDFSPIPPGAPEDTPVSFSVRNEATGESWSGGAFRCPLDDKALADLRWYLEEYGEWPFGPFRERAHGIEARLEVHGRALFNALFDAREAARIYEHFLNTEADVRTLTILSDSPRVMRLPWSCWPSPPARSLPSDRPSPSAAACGWSTPRRCASLRCRCACCW
jgi:hypothetical protein